MDKTKKVFVFCSASALLIVVAFIPTYLFLLLKSMINPVEFWELLAVFTLGILGFGGVQGLLLWLLAAALIHIWFEEWPRW